VRGVVSRARDGVTRRAGIGRMGGVSRWIKYGMSRARGGVTRRGGMIRRGVG